ncbi:MAG: ABC transporter ATP-binding protein [Clostridium sp.]|nr:ABC transporter ATP-binding protein [Clostridium sp.]
MIEIKNVSKIYGKGDAAVNALRNVNITIADGEFVSIIGPSGSGKSTLLNILGGIDTPTSGEYYLNKNNIATLSNKKIADIRNIEFGFVLQYFGLINDYTVYENVMLPLKYSNKFKGKERKNRVNKMIEDMGLKEKLKKYPTELSGGQCQRVAIARAIVNNPNIIFADEPTGALDRTTGNQIFNILRELNKEGKTVVIVSHDENIYSKCDRIIKIEDGQIISDSIVG